MPEEQAIDTSGVNIPKLIGRIVLYGILVALLVVAGLDWKMKQDYTKTAEAWDAKLEKLNDSYYVKELEEDATGSFKSEVVNEGVMDRDIIYSWKGVIRTYRIKVTADTDEDDSSSQVLNIKALASSKDE